LRNPALALLLDALRSPNARDAWAEFLDTYSPVLYQTARASTSNEDSAADCYLHICEELARNHFRRLLKFRLDGPASFTTWLRVVARNLCFDWHRSQAGRLRPFKALEHLSPLELEVFNCRFVHGASTEQTVHTLERQYAGVSSSEIQSIEERLQNCLTSRQRWILGSRTQPAFTTPVAVAGEDERGLVDIPASDPSPEALLADRQQKARLEKGLAMLSCEERLLVQMRYEQDLSLEEIARVCGLRDGQRVHRMLAAILKKLRRLMR
jgi:RNA polymerase sigma factor (sigma-70 family)